jgi:acetyl-CoA carboxylase biotin carboxylase subunit
MIKASAGGGGKGMRISWSEKDFEQSFDTAKMEAEKAFADGTMYIERYVANPRHIEFQILADQYGNTIHLGERDCSVQRKHQKMIEESPCAAISDDLRKKMGETAVRAAKAAGYYSVGTIEFLLDQSNEFYFIEMNTRIQVEHPVTEMVTGIDLIKEQIRVAAGEKLTIRQEDVKIKGHAIECRINAEDPKKNFMPCPGLVKDVHFPGGMGIRVESPLYSGYTIPPYYDSMVVKLIVHDKNRELALKKMRSALGELIIQGVTTNLDFQYELICDEEFQNGRIDTGYIERFLERTSHPEVRNDA